MKNENDYERIARFILESDMPRKEQKLDGLRKCELRGHPLRYNEEMDMLLLDGVSIDPAELEDGYWL